MKKLLLTLLLSTSLSTFADDHLESLPDGFCYESPKVQVRNSLFFLPNQSLPFTGENLCVYSKNGQYHSQGEITNGKQEGWWIWWKENGEIWKKEQYEDGDKTGYKKINPTFNDYGQIESELISNRYGNLVGEIKYTYYESGQKKWELNFQDGMYDGKQTLWYENGQIKREENYKDGHFDGKWVEWDENGQKEFERNFQNGVEMYDTSISYYGNRLVEKERK